MRGSSGDCVGGAKGRARKGAAQPVSKTLYRADGRLLREPTEAITLDTGMMLIGLSECLRSSIQAEKVLRDISCTPAEHQPVLARAR
jgi:hypothetical protein